MKTRTITAAVLIAITIPFLALGGFWTVAFVSAMVIGGVWEVLKSRGTKFPIAVYIIAIIGTLGSLLWVFITYLTSNPEGFVELFKNKEAFELFQSQYMVRTNIIYIGTYLSALLLCEVASKRFDVSDVFYIFTLSLLLSFAGQGLIFLRFNSLSAICYIFIANYMCDTFALLSGKFFGKHKLAPTISPKKTWEGAIGGVLMSTILSFTFYCIFPFDIPNITGWVTYLVVFIFSVGLGVFAVIGDLIFSSIKRYYGIKDFGTIFPGHGGVLDRIDSLMFNILIFISMYALLTGGKLFLA